MRTLLATILLLLAPASPASAFDVFEDRTVWLDDKLQANLTFTLLGVRQALDWTLANECRSASFSPATFYADVRSRLTNRPDLSPTVAVVYSYSKLARCEDAVKRWVERSMGRQ
jgi:hypothetical protein